MYILLPLVGVGILLFYITKKTSREGKEDSNKFRLPPSPPLSSPSPVKEEEKTKIVFREANTLPIDLQKDAILFLFCHRTGLLNNISIFSKLYPYMSVCQPFDIVKKEQKFYNAPAKKIDIEKCKEYEKLINNKFKRAIYSDEKEADFIVNELKYYLETRYNLVKTNKNFTENIEFIYTDNYAISFVMYKKYFNSSKRIIANKVYTNKNINVPNTFDKFSFKYIKHPQPDKNLIQKTIGKLGEYTPDILESIIRKINDELGRAIIVSSITQSGGLGLIVYASQKALGKDKANMILTEIYGLAGGVIAGVFSVGVGFEPARRLSRAQAKFILTGDPKVVFEIVKGSEADKALTAKMKELGGIEDNSFDTMIFQE